MSDLDAELKTGEQLASALVAHLFRMGGAARAEIPVSHVEADGSLTLWKVIVEQVQKLDFGAG